MAGNDYGVRFTDNQYSSKQDVAKALGTSLIDNFWKQILEYRSKFQHVITLRNINKAPFRVTFSPTIIGKISELEKKLNLLLSKYKANFETRDNFKFALKTQILTDVSKFNNIFLLPPRYKALAKNANPTTVQEVQIAAYLKALFELENFPPEFISTDLLARLYSLCSDNEGKMVLFRETEFNNASKMAFVREYTSAPVNLIEPLIDNLCDFIANSDQSVVVKMVGTYYSLSLIKPFEKHNDEIACLFTKAVLSYCGYSQIAPYLPLENLLVINRERFKNLMMDVQRENDLTYILTFVIDMLNSAVETYIYEINNAFYSSAENEIKQDAMEDLKVLDNDQKDSISLFDTPQPEPICEEKKVEVKKEEPLPSVEPKPVYVESVQPKPVPVTQPKIEQPKPVAVKPVTVKPTKIEDSFNYVKEDLRLSERDAQKYEKELLETYPTLKKKQAHFYAKHCALGRYYTIQQFKKFTGCVYETARTSMDSLAELGLYKKEQIKNKFVYTPVKQ